MSKEHSAKNNTKHEPGKTLSVWDFISLVSHQLRNPLASTKLSLETLLAEELGSLNEDQREYLKMLREDNQKMIALVKDFLAISQVERGEITLKKEENVDLGEITREIIHELKPFAAAHNVHLPLLETAPPILVTCDSIKIREVIYNLIDNAIKYNQKERKIEIEIKRNPDAVIFTCRDTGIGVPEKDREHIFSKFFRAENAGKTDPGGTGIGLYLAEAIVEASGGKIGFESKENEGSTFWFTLPITNK